MIDRDSELVKMFSRIISEQAEDFEVPPLKDEDICTDWGYAIMDKYFATPGTSSWIRGKQFSEAKSKHDKMVEKDPDNHKITKSDTINGKHCMKCSCGFSYKYDSGD